MSAANLVGIKQIGANQKEMVHQGADAELLERSGARPAPAAVRRRDTATVKQGP